MATADVSVWKNFPAQIIGRVHSEQLAALDGSIAEAFTVKDGENSARPGTLTDDYLLKNLVVQPVNISLNFTESAPYLQVMDAAEEQTVITFNDDSSLTPLNLQLLLTPVASINHLIRSNSDAGGTGNSSQIPSAVVDSVNRFNIQLDYQFDTNGFFNDPNRRAVLDAAADYWENIIQDEFTNISAGTEVFVENPQTGAEERFVLDQGIDDLLVFVGARDLGAGVLGEGGPSGLLANSNLVERYTGSNFEPWTGSVTFSSTTGWFFDPTLNTSDDIPDGSYDFFSSALHELGHVLGIGTSAGFRALTTENSFTGSRSTAANGGTPVPLSSDLSHLIPNGLATLMDPSSPPGSRSFVTPLDTAVLADLGYLV